MWGSAGICLGLALPSHLTMVPGHPCIANPRSEVGRHTAPGAAHFISDMLQTLTKTFCILPLHGQYLEVGERLPGPLDMPPQVHFHPPLEPARCAACGSSI